MHTSLPSVLMCLGIRPAERGIICTYIICIFQTMGAESYTARDYLWSGTPLLLVHLRIISAFCSRSTAQRISSQDYRPPVRGGGRGRGDMAPERLAKMYCHNISRFFLKLLEEKDSSAIRRMDKQSTFTTRTMFLQYWIFAALLCTLYITRHETKLSENFEAYTYCIAFLVNRRAQAIGKHLGVQDIGTI